MTDGGQVPIPSTAALLRSLAIAAAACALLASPAGAYVLRPFASKAATVKITTHPPAAAASATAKLAWKTTGSGLTVRCRLDAGAYAACRTSHTYSHLTQGMHTFTVRVTGGATRTATYRWRVDTTAPAAPVVSGGTGAWSAVPVTLSATGASDAGGSGVASYQHRSSANGGASFGAPAAGASVKVSTDGTTFVQFRALDRAGNRLAMGTRGTRPGRDGDGRHHRPLAPGAHRRLERVGERGVRDGAAHGHADGRGLGVRRVRVPLVDRRRRDVVAAGRRRDRGRHGRGNHGGRVPVARRPRQRLGLDGARPGDARPNGAVGPGAVGRVDVVAGRADRDGVGERIDRRGLGPGRIRVRDLDERRQHLVRADDRGERPRLDPGHDARAIRGHRRRRPRIGLDAGDRQARPDGSRQRRR